MSKSRNLADLLDASGDVKNDSLDNVTPATATNVSDNDNSSTGYFDVPAGTTAQRPSNPNTGYTRFNTTLGYLEQYTLDGWTVIAAPPTVTNVSPSSYLGASGTSFTITGSGFDSGSTVKFVTSGGTEYTAGSVTFNNSSSLTATTPQNFSVADEPLGVKVVASTGLSALLADQIDCGGSPSWNTASGSLGSVEESTAFSATVSATDPDGQSVSYSITSGSLPSGISLNGSTGAITGTAPSVSSDTTYNFTIAATDGINTTSRSFSITVTNVVAVVSLNQGNTTATTTQTGSFTVPSGANTMTLFGCAGGGCGGSGFYDDNGSAAGGGGAANLSGYQVAVTGGDTISWQIGVGARTTGNANGLSGSQTWVKKNGTMVLQLGGGNGGGANGGSASAGGTVIVGSGVNGGGGGYGGIRGNRSGGNGASVTNGCAGGGGGGAHESYKNGGTGGTSTVTVGTANLNGITVSFAGTSGGTRGGADNEGNYYPSSGQWLAAGGHGVQQDGNTGSGGGAGAGIKPIVNGVAHDWYYGAGGGGNRSYIVGVTTQSNGGITRYNGQGGNGFLIAVCTS
jgi:hypothetical protein